MRKALLTSTMLAGMIGSEACAQTSSAIPPPAAAASGFGVQTYSSSVDLGGAWKPFDFFGNNPSSVGAVQNPNGSVTITGGGNNYNAQISTASAGKSGWTGEAFGGGGYFSATMAIAGKPGSMSGGWPSFWANTIESMAGGKQSLDNEVDVMEMDSGANSYGTAIHDWYGGARNSVSTHNATVSIPPGTDLSQPHTYGMLWTPATEAMQGSMQWFFDGKPVGTADHWDKYNPSQSSAANPYAALDSSHLALILGTGPDNPITVSNVQVWQASSANNLINGAPASAAMASPSAEAASPRPPGPSPASNNVANYVPPPCSGGTPNYAASAGGFGVLGGQIYAPGGQPFTARGVNVMNGNGNPAAAQIQSSFPGTNFVRLAIYSYDSPAALTAYVNDLTSHGIVVELENHNNGAGDAGGGQGSVFTGAALANEQAWYSSVASAFKTNPYVWFGTNNEPPNAGSALSAWQGQTYDTIRGAGNNNPVMVEMNCDASGCGAGYTPSVYAKMTNVAWDMHYYGWVSGYSTDQTAVSNKLSSLIADTHAIQSADGQIPVIIGEYGNSTTGRGIDANGSQVVSAVAQSGVGSAAWAWGTGNPGDGLTNGDGSPSAYGQQVAAFTAGSGATGCAQSPIPVPVSQPAPSSQPGPVAQTTTPVSAAISPGQGSATDAGGNTYTITADGSAMEDGRYLPGGGGTSQLVVRNGVLYGRDDGHGPINPGGWFTFANGYWTPSAPPPLGAQPVTAPALTSASTATTAPTLATSAMSINQVAALAAGGH